MNTRKICSLFLYLILFMILLLTSAGPAGRAERMSAPQRLRVRVEQARLNAGQGTKVIVEFVDLNYGQVANDATREIEFGQMSSGGSQTGSGNLNPQKILVKPGVWSGETTFTSSQIGRLLITANSEGLESGQTLVSVVPHKSSFLAGLFETVAYADPVPGLEISPREGVAAANGRHRAEFQLCLDAAPPAGTMVRIKTTLTSGSIYYKDELVGTTIANIPLEENEDVSGRIAIESATPGTFEVSASVRPNGPSDIARVTFTQPRPTKIKFDPDPDSFASDAGYVPVSVHLADDGGFKIDPDKERRIEFKPGNDGKISFRPASVEVGPGKATAQVMFRLEELPLGNEITIQGESDGISAGLKTMIIKSAIEKLLIKGPTEVVRGNEAEYTIYFAGKDDNPRAADWAREIDLSASGGTLDTTQLNVAKGSRKAVVKYSSTHAVGKYTLTASSGGIQAKAYAVEVVNPTSWLVFLAVFGGLIGGVARQFHDEKKFDRVFSKRIAGSLVSGLFLYLAIKLGLWQALGSPTVPAAFDPGTLIVAFFVGGLGGFVGTPILARLAGWITSSPVPAAKADARPVVQP